MENYYKKLGLSEGATREQVDEQYRKLMKIYDSQNVAEPSQRAFVEKSKKEITDAYNAITAPKTQTAQAARTATAYAEAPQTEFATSTSGEYRTNTAAAYAQDTDDAQASQYSYDNKKEMYTDVRRLLQNGEYKLSLSILNENKYLTDAEWNYLMGSALYFSGFVSKSYAYFADAVRLAPDNSEYTAVYNRLKGGRTGRVYNSPRTIKNSTSASKALDLPAGIIGCILCVICCLD